MLLDRQSGVVVNLQILSLFELHLAFHSLPVINAHLNYFQRVLDEVVFYFGITLCIRIELGVWFTSIIQGLSF